MLLILQQQLCFDSASLNIFKQINLIQLRLIQAEDFDSSCMQDVNLILPLINIPKQKISNNSNHYFVNFQTIIDDQLLQTWYGNFSLGTNSPQSITEFNIELADYTMCFKNTYMTYTSNFLQLYQEKWAECDFSFMSSIAVQLIFNFTDEIIQITQLGGLSLDGLYDIKLTLYSDEVDKFNQLFTLTDQLFLQIYDYDEPSLFINIPLYNVSNKQALIEKATLFQSQLFIQFDQQLIKNMCQDSQNGSLDIRVTKISQNIDYYSQFYEDIYLKSQLSFILNERQKNTCQEVLFSRKSSCQLILDKNSQQFSVQLDNFVIQSSDNICTDLTLHYFTFSIFKQESSNDHDIMFLSSFFQYYNITSVTALISKRQICLTVIGDISSAFSIVLENQQAKKIVEVPFNNKLCIKSDFSQIISASNPKDILGFLNLKPDSVFYFNDITIENIIIYKVILSFISISITTVSVTILYFLTRRLQLS